MRENFQRARSPMGSRGKDIMVRTPPSSTYRRTHGGNQSIASHLAVEKEDTSLEEGYIEDICGQLCFVPDSRPSPRQTRVPSVRVAGGQLFWIRKELVN
jgi:hypothetical protein